MINIFIEIVTVMHVAFAVPFCKYFFSYFCIYLLMHYVRSRCSTDVTEGIMLLHSYL
jgi:hypothetical protein